jgi:arylsulfatase A-like enzyme
VARPAPSAIERVFDLDAIRAKISLAGFRPADRPGAEHPDILLITIDTVRVDHTPPYGGKASMPFLAGLAARGAVFDWAFAPSNVTRRSIPSMVIGLAPNRVRGRVKGWSLRLDPRHVLVAERLRAAGYETAGFMCCDNFWGPSAGTGWSRGLEHVETEKNGLALARRASAWLARREQTPGQGRRPLFLWMHIIEPHVWAQGATELPPEPARDQMYDRSLTASDKAVAELVGAFAQRAPEAAPIVIVTADHGEALGDHGQPFHSSDLYNSQIRVPLVVAGPGIQVGRVAETVSLTGLAATLVELAGFTPPEMDAASFAQLARGTRPADPEAGDAFSAMIQDRSNPGGIVAVVRGRWKLIVNSGRPELYDVHADPEERHDLAAAQPAKVAELRALLADKLHASRPVFAE